MAIDKSTIKPIEEGQTGRVVADNMKENFDYLADSIPTKLSEMSEDTSHRVVSDTEKTAWNGKVDKVEGKGLSTNDFTTEEKNKLAIVSDNASSVIFRTW